MIKYRMDLFELRRKIIHPKPVVWRRHDIFAIDDGAAKVAAEKLYRAHAMQRTLTHFSLYEGAGRFVYTFPAGNSG